MGDGVIRIDPSVTELPEPIPWNGKCVCEGNDLCAMHGLEMKDKELAQRVVDFGVGLYLITDQKHSMLSGPEEHFELDGCSMSDSDFVRDWRVAGALIQKCQDHGWTVEIIHDGTVFVYTGLMDLHYDVAESEPGSDTPLSYVQACVEALA